MQQFGGKGGKAEYLVTSGVTRNKSGQGRADIVYFNAKIRTVEVYEIKPGSYSPGAPNHGMGMEQLDGYILALRSNGQIVNNWSVKRGYSLNSYFNQMVIHSKLHEEKEIVYRVYENGLINYYYRKRKNETEAVSETEEEKEKNMEKLRIAGQVIETTAGAYVLYRGIRFMVSLIPPLWPTIPYNVVCP